LTISPAVRPAGSDAFAVEPVVDYEPPTRTVPPCRQPVHHRTPRPPRRPYRTRREPVATAAVLSAPMRQAAVFADAALRRVLEVIDRRRPVAQLRPLLAPSLIDPVGSVSRGIAARDGAAVLRRMRLQPVGRRDHEAAAEVFGSYSRGERMHAIACRVEKSTTSTGARWQVVALHIG
jgi:Family of unknown function (DUF6459)